MSDIHVGDIGTIFRLTIMDGTSVVDISGATTMEIIFKKPSASVVTETASFTTDGTDGQMEWATGVVGDLDEAGSWEWQGRIVMPSWEGKTSILTFDVVANLS
jgi:hypothetical protein